MHYIYFSMIKRGSKWIRVREECSCDLGKNHWVSWDTEVAA